MKMVICSFSSPVPAPGLEPWTISTNDKRAKPLNHAAALSSFMYGVCFGTDYYYDSYLRA
jgi:hypothetical protein